MKKLKEILLVDDSISSSQYNRIVLNEMEVSDRITLKSSAEEALNYLKGDDENGVPPQPDLILLDIAMPQMDGFDFMDKYIELPEEATNNMKIVIAIVSDYLGTENLEKSKDYQSYGLLDHIKKPVDKEDIDNILYEYFER